MIIGDFERVEISAATTAWLASFGGDLRRARVSALGTRPEIAYELAELRLVSLHYVQRHPRGRRKADETKRDADTKPDPRSVWLTASEAAERAGVTPTAIRKAIRRGDLVGTQAVGYRTTLADLNNWIARRNERQ
jgi:hypothetical protein